MRDHFKGLCGLGSLALLLIILFAVSPFSTHPTYASALIANWRGYTTNWDYVRSAPTTKAPSITTYPPGTSVTVYATISGQAVWYGNAEWDRISNPGSTPLYIYGGLVSRNAGGNDTPSLQGKEIIVSLSRQWLYAYQNGLLAFNTAVMTGRQALPTPTGTYHVFAKFSPTTFYSPWPTSSPYYYPPTYINYALEWRAGGYFLHDSWWHSIYGPGTNGWHYDPVDGWQWGTHGCVAMPLNAAAWLYHWAPIGTTVQIID